MLRPAALIYTGGGVNQFYVIVIVNNTMCEIRIIGMVTVNVVLVQGPCYHRYPDLTKLHTCK